MEYQVMAGYVTVPTAVDDRKIAHIDIPRGEILPADVPDEHVQTLLARGHIAPVDDIEPDPEPEAAEAVDGVPDGPVAAVLEWVGADPARAAEALAVERARETPRTGVVTALTKIIPEQ